MKIQESSNHRRSVVCADHVHLCLSIPPKIAISEFMGYLKGKSALMIYDRYPELGNKLSGTFGHVGIIYLLSEMLMRQRSQSISGSRKKNRIKKLVLQSSPIMG